MSFNKGGTTVSGAWMEARESGRGSYSKRPRISGGSWGKGERTKRKAKHKVIKMNWDGGSG